MNIEHFKAKYSASLVDLQVLFSNSKKSVDKSFYYDTSCLDELENDSESYCIDLNGENDLIEQTEMVSLNK